MTRLTEFLRNYRSTPHATTNVAPITLFLRNGVTTRLPKYKNSLIPTLIDVSARKEDKYKNHIQKANAEIRKKPKTRHFQVEDTVLVKQDMAIKSMAKYDQIPYRITYINHTLITASRDNKTITRNISFFKHLRIIDDTKQPLKVQNFEKSKFNSQPKGIRFYFKKGGENMNEDSEDNTNNNTNKSPDNEYESIDIRNSDKTSNNFNYLDSDEEQTVIEITKSEEEELDELNNNISARPIREERLLVHTLSDPEILHGQNTKRVLRPRNAKNYIYKRRYTKKR